MGSADDLQTVYDVYRSGSPQLSCLGVQFNAVALISTSGISNLYLFSRRGTQGGSYNQLQFLQCPKCLGVDFNAGSMIAEIRMLCNQTCVSVTTAFYSSSPERKQFPLRRTSANFTHLSYTVITGTVSLPTFFLGDGCPCPCAAMSLFSSFNACSTILGQL